jgi:hypothetical protein
MTTYSKETEMIKGMAESLSWEIQSVLLAIRDDGEIRETTIPGNILECLHWGEFIKVKGGIVKLTDLGKKLSYFCSC